MQWTSSGFIYFARVDGFDAIKIGWASDPVARLQSIAKEIGAPIECIGLMPGTRVDERDMHVALSRHRFSPSAVPVCNRTEWFYAPEVNAFMADHGIARESFVVGVPKRDIAAPVRKPKAKQPTTEGMRLFVEWCATHGETQRHFAKWLGVSQALVGFWRVGSARPGAHLRLAIERLTGIPADAWMTDAEYLVAYARPRLVSG